MLPCTVTVGRVLPPGPLADLDAYRARGGGRAVEALAAGAEPRAVIDTLAAAGLRGRGGAGFPTATKWRTVLDNRSDVLATTVVVNGAEGEPWTAKDRAIVAHDPYQVLEGAIVAARVVGANEVVFATKASFPDVAARVRAAIDEVVAAGWAEGLAVRVHEGPDEYLFGEETGLLEAIDGRPPFPRIAPPFRRGTTEVVDDPDAVDDGSGVSAEVELAGPGAATVAPPALVDNVETLAHAAWIVAEGDAWFRALGTAATPGTVVATVTGLGVEAAVGEVATTTTVRQAIEAIAGTVPGDLGAVVVGASNRPLTPAELDTPLCFDALAATGSGLGSATIRLVGADEVVPTVAGISRFLAVESCGQCEPCKRDGLAIADLLDELVAGTLDDDGAAALADRVATVADGARCALGRQHEAVVGGLLARFAPAVARHRARPAGSRVAVRAYHGPDDDALAADEVPVKQPDWTDDETWSGATPVDRFTDHRAPAS